MLQKFRFQPSCCLGVLCCWCIFPGTLTHFYFNTSLLWAPLFEKEPVFQIKLAFSLQPKTIYMAVGGWNRRQPAWPWHLYCYLCQSHCLEFFEYLCGFLRSFPKFYILATFSHTCLCSPHWSIFKPYRKWSLICIVYGVLSELLNSN